MYRIVAAGTSANPVLSTPDTTMWIVVTVVLAILVIAAIAFIARRILTSPNVRRSDSSARRSIQ